jgi:hypothetical protein
MANASARISNPGAPPKQAEEEEAAKERERLAIMI